MRVGFTLAMAILVLKVLLPEVAEGLIVVVLKMLSIASTSIDQAQTGAFITAGFPQ